ncbi:UDP-N-acetylglucosamine acyltransferase [Cryobacterium flavum]|uniref:Acyl-ACP--UDP-N-acetylglucosamine O-acyltransferase n=1 Tax=Cryobacterium flavum TaxID=1424659 RepID=A0A4V3IA03_9MICO|nr:hypothetical protein [Cryobacterium flavum]TFB81428.1 acyl-ACP--UDP-N- acetylglucosamine O-acyltransferase [Cryobacterium flavum]SDO40439.1 UDP-N-acetylglucosamine acyltransferase [Cryobacterium flavum]
MTNSIHPTAIISGDVKLGVGNTVGAFVVISGPVSIGDNNWIGTGTMIGPPPEVRSFAHPIALADATGNGVAIGSRNVIREGVQIHQGWKAQTRLGDDSFVMNQAYIAHDCVLGDGVTLASSVLLAGHVKLGSGANLGLGTVVHQRVQIGAGSMVGMGSVVTHDVPPFAKAYGSPARVHGANIVAMERQGVSRGSIDQVEGVYSGQSEPWDFAGVELNTELSVIFSTWQDR